MRHRGLLAMLVVAIALLVGAASASAGQRYVALGDSYSSGVGTRTYFDSNCKKSNYAYPAIIDVERPNTDLVFAACSGAKTGDVLANQVSSLTSGTAIVTITIGGNDAGFSDVITECAFPSWASDCNGAIDAAQSYINNTLPGRLNLVYDQIRSRSPSATVVVLGYPRLFMGVDCNGGTWFSSQRDDAPEPDRRPAPRRHARARAGVRVHVQGRHPAVRRPCGLLVDRMDKRVVESRERELPPQPRRPAARLHATGKGCDRLIA